MAVPLPLRWPVDLLVTLTLWIYVAVGGPVLLLPAYLVVVLTTRDRRAAFQRLHHWFLRGFFRLLRAIDPGLRVRLDPTIREIRGAVVICNHLSYLDPLLLIALLPRHVTFVKRRFFSVPVFGWCLRAAGYVAAAEGTGLDEGTLRRLDGLRRHVEQGGTLFVFPEGRRARNGELGKFHAGAFRLARRFGVPLELVRLEGTDRVFPRGRFLLHTCVPVAIVAERLGPLPAPPDGEGGEVGRWVEEARRVYETRLEAARSRTAV